VLLECGVAHLAALSATTEQRATLRLLVEQMDRAATWAEFHHADENFHLTVAEATQLPPAARQYGLVLRDLYRYYLPYPVKYLRDSNCEHRELLDAFDRRDPVAAVQIAHTHVNTLHASMFVGLSGTNGVTD
jgi:DNA-binding FadR family transcriptional regulator